MYGMIGNTVDKNRKCERNDIVCNLGILTYSGGNEEFHSTRLCSIRTIDEENERYYERESESGV